MSDEALMVVLLVTFAAVALLVITMTVALVLGIGDRPPRVTVRAWLARRDFEGVRYRANVALLFGLPVALVTVGAIAATLTLPY